ncbi:MAG: hypothetical protein ABIC68_00875 [Candidatus Omnitrophota bacterium]
MNINVVDARKLDYEKYADFQKEAYKDLLAVRGASDAFMVPGFYRWKYATPFGYAKIAQVVEGEKVVSSSAMIPLRIWDKEDCFTGWQCLDVATLPEARRKGYFLATLKELVKCVPRNEIFYAFPNEKSIPSFLKLNCSENVLLTTWVNPLAMITRRKYQEIVEISEFNGNCDRLANELARKGLMLDRSAAFLNWRYFQHPNNSYVCFSYVRNEMCLGLAIVRKAHILSRNIVLVMELLAADDAIKTRLLRHVAAWTIDQKENTIAMMNSAFSLKSGLMAGFFPVPSLFLPKRQILVVYSADLQGRDILRKNWSIQTGDWDVF